MNKQLQRDVESATSAIDSLVAEIDRLEEEVKELNERLDYKEVLIEDLREQLNDLKS